MSLTKAPAAVVNIIMWSGIEACASTLCANLPCYGSLLGRARSITSIVPVFSSFLSIRTTRNSGGASSRGKSAHSPSASRENILWLETRVENVIEGGALGAASRGEGRNVELGSIRVDNSINIDS